MESKRLLFCVTTDVYFVCYNWCQIAWHNFLHSFKLFYNRWQRQREILIEIFTIIFLSGFVSNWSVKAILQCLEQKWLRCQFHQHFTHAFCAQKCFAQLSSSYSLALYFFGAKILAQKLLVKCWWNWLQY